ncbi:MAG: Clp protease N-terminal domain-containing protein [Patescibacteria group bacterium]|jgi:ATP-dependent Clp protease ATP-binding subunit ClpC
MTAVDDEKSLAETDNYKKAKAIALLKATEYVEDYASTEHILLGLLAIRGCAAIKVLRRIGISKTAVYKDLRRYITKGYKRRKEEVGWTPRALRIFYLAEHEAEQLGNNYLGTEHLLLSLIREQDGLAGRTLTRLGVKLEAARKVTTVAQGHKPIDNPR